MTSFNPDHADKMSHEDEVVIKQTVHRNDYGTEIPFNFFDGILSAGVKFQGDPIINIPLRQEKDITDQVEIVDERVGTRLLSGTASLPPDREYIIEIE